VTALMVEGIIFCIGIYFYLHTTRARNNTGIFAFWVLVAFFVLINIMNLFGPPPPDVRSIAWAGNLQWLFVIWGWWVDRNRISVKSGNIESSESSTEVN
jgi:hypothetical protein